MGQVTGQNTVSHTSGSTFIHATQIGGPAELTSSWDSLTGYSWKRRLLSGVTVGNSTLQETGDHAVTPDNDTTLASGTQGWLEPDPNAGGWFFLPAGSSSTTSGSSPCGAGCGWIAALNSQTDCLLVTVASRSGACDCPPSPPPPPVSYNCVDNVCTDPGDGTGFFSSLALCTASLCDPPPPAVTYDCLAHICVDPGDGTGVYASLADCEAAPCDPAPPAPTYNCVGGFVSGHCVDPGDGTGVYPSLYACLNGFIPGQDPGLPCPNPPVSPPVSYNCIADVCTDPGDGTGTYTTLSDCLTSPCGAPPVSWACEAYLCVAKYDGTGPYATSALCLAGGCAGTSYVAGSRRCCSAQNTLTSCVATATYTGTCASGLLSLAGSWSSGYTVPAEGGAQWTKTTTIGGKSYFGALLCTGEYGDWTAGLSDGTNNWTATASAFCGPDANTITVTATFAFYGVPCVGLITFTWTLSP